MVVPLDDVYPDVVSPARRSASLCDPCDPCDPCAGTLNFFEAVKAVSAMS